jgi:hypothetical protein
VQISHHGRHRKLFNNIRVEDVVWISTQLGRLTDIQWRDAFRAGGVPPATADRYIRRLKARVADGLAL